MKDNKHIKKIQFTIFEIFNETITICKKHNIDYFILGGTALGAVRHKGFIPWDDDLDIGMTRVNYNKFLNIAQKDLPNNYFLQTYFSEPNTPFYFAKIRKDNTMLMEYYSRKLNIHHGLYIDIFPFDNIPDDIIQRKKHWKLVNFWSNLFIAKSLTGSSVPQKSVIGKMKLFVRWFLHILLKPISKTYLFQKLDSASQMYNETNTSYVSFVKLPLLKIPRIDIDNLAKIKFEGIEVSCPNNIESYLESNFGDYMKLPPIDQRVGHRPYKLVLQ